MEEGEEDEHVAATYTDGFEANQPAMLADGGLAPRDHIGDLRALVDAAAQAAKQAVFLPPPPPEGGEEKAAGSQPPQPPPPSSAKKNVTNMGRAWQQHVAVVPVQVEVPAHIERPTAEHMRFVEGDTVSYRTPSGARGQGVIRSAHPKALVLPKSKHVYFEMRYAVIDSRSRVKHTQLGQEHLGMVSLDSERDVGAERKQYKRLSVSMTKKRNSLLARKARRARYESFRGDIRKKPASRRRRTGRKTGRARKSAAGAGPQLTPEQLAQNQQQARADQQNDTLALMLNLNTGFGGKKKAQTAHVAVAPSSLSGDDEGGVPGYSGDVSSTPRLPGLPMVTDLSDRYNLDMDAQCGDLAGEQDAPGTQDFSSLAIEAEMMMMAEGPEATPSSSSSLLAPSTHPSGATALLAPAPTAGLPTSALPTAVLPASVLPPTAGLPASVMPATTAGLPASVMPVPTAGLPTSVMPAPISGLPAPTSVLPVHTSVLPAPTAGPPVHYPQSTSSSLPESALASTIQPLESTVSIDAKDGLQQAAEPTASMDSGVLVHHNQVMPPPKALSDGDDMCDDGLASRQSRSRSRGSRRRRRSSHHRHSSRHQHHDDGNHTQDYNPYYQDASDEDDYRHYQNELSVAMRTPSPAFSSRRQSAEYGRESYAPEQPRYRRRPRPYRKYASQTIISDDEEDESAYYPRQSRSLPANYQQLAEQVGTSFFAARELLDFAQPVVSTTVTTTTLWQPVLDKRTGKTSFLPVGQSHQQPVYDGGASIASCYDVSKPQRQQQRQQHHPTSAAEPLSLDTI